MLSAIPRVNALPTPFAFTATLLPLTVTAPVVLPIVVIAPAPVAIEVLPVEERVVKAPLAAVVTPIFVLLIPVAVALKLPDITVRSLAPRLILDADRPERDKLPLVALRLSAPVVIVSPLDAVSKPLEVIVPVPVVEILPVVDKVPASVIVNVGVPPD